MREQFYICLMGFFKAHPEYQSNPFYMTGESYAGKYLPHIAFEVVKQNKQNPNNRINLQGVMIGNGLHDPLRHFLQIPQLYETLGMVNSTGVDKATNQLLNCTMLYQSQATDRSFRGVQQSVGYFKPQRWGPIFI
eukprot:UN34246